MPERVSNKVELSPQARQALEAEAVLRRTNLKDLASELILGSVSKRSIQFIDIEKPKVRKAETIIIRKSLEKDSEAIATIKQLWAEGMRNRTEISRKVPQHSRRTVTAWIARAIERGELKEDQAPTNSISDETGHS